MTLEQAEHLLRTHQARALYRPGWHRYLVAAPYGYLLEIWPGQGGGVSAWLGTPVDRGARDWRVVPCRTRGVAR